MLITTIILANGIFCGHIGSETNKSKVLLILCTSFQFPKDKAYTPLSDYIRDALKVLNLSCLQGSREWRAETSEWQSTSPSLPCHLKPSRQVGDVAKNYLFVNTNVVLCRHDAVSVLDLSDCCLTSDTIRSEDKETTKCVVKYHFSLFFTFNVFSE